jgi:RsiW-degrading membrane proteinase PrsW (M82 family)
VRRYAIALITFGLTLGAMLWVLFVDTDDLVALALATVGLPTSILLLVRAVLAPPVGSRAGIGSFVLGATLVPAGVLVIGAAATGALVALVDPLRHAAIDLGSELSVNTDFVEVLFAGWAFLLLVELAIVAPVLEETLKPFGAVIARPRSRTEALLFGAAAGAGFAVIENILYATGWLWGGEWWISIAVIRMSGSALHLLGTALVALAVFELRYPKEERLISLPIAYGIAFTVHAVWNGSIAVAIVLFAGQDRLGLPDDSLGWGVALLVLLAAFGAVLAAALVAVARLVRDNEPLHQIASMESLRQPEAIAAWVLLTAWLLVPIGIAVKVFPGLISL